MATAVAGNEICFGPVEENWVYRFVGGEDTNINQVHRLWIALRAAVLCLGLQVAVLEGAREILTLAVVSSLEENQHLLSIRTCAHVNVEDRLTSVEAPRSGVDAVHELMKGGVDAYCWQHK